jgi:hypothetical protein
MNKHFNNLTPAEAERLAMLAEECAEVIQIVGKILRHGYDSYHPKDPSMDNRDLLAKELADLDAVNREMHRAELKDYDASDAFGTIWKKKLRFTHHQYDSLTNEGASCDPAAVAKLTEGRG